MIVDVAEPGARRRTERYEIYEFVPIDLARNEPADRRTPSVTSRAGRPVRGRPSGIPALPATIRQEPLNGLSARAIQLSQI